MKQEMAAPENGPDGRREKDYSLFAEDYKLRLVQRDKLQELIGQRRKMIAEEESSGRAKAVAQIRREVASLERELEAINRRIEADLDYHRRATEILTRYDPDQMRQV